MRTYFQLRAGRLEEVKGEVVREQPLTVYIDGERFLTLLCSPFQLEPLVLGYLWMEKVITGLHEVTSLRISEVDGRGEIGDVSGLPSGNDRPQRRVPDVDGRAARLVSRLGSKMEPEDAQHADGGERHHHGRHAPGIHSGWARCGTGSVLRWRGGISP